MNPRRVGARVARQALRAASPLTRVRPVSAPRHPIFLIGCPRSGTSLLYAILQNSPEVAALPGEGHVLWESLHHPKYHGWDSNVLGPKDATQRDRAFFYAAIRAWSRGRRYLDKTPKNSLRIPYLTSLFPDADFIFLRRQGPDNVNSLIQGWRAHPRFVTYTLPPAAGEERGRDWSFVLIPGWRELVSAPVEEIAAHQYVSCNEAGLAAAGLVDPSRWISISYEDLVARPEEEVARILDRLGLGMTRAITEMVRRLDDVPINTVTPPKADKWRDENRAEIERILPIIEPTERRLGYTPVRERLVSSG